MAISTLATLATSLVPPLHFIKRAAGVEANGTLISFWHQSRANVMPPAGNMPTTLAGATCNNLTTGALPFVDPPGGSNAYLAGVDWACRFGGSAIIIDRLWNNLITATTVTTAQSIVGMSVLPARDANGTTSGYLVSLAAEVYSTTGNAAVLTITANYTNHLGTAGRTAVCQQFFATCQSGTLIPFNLQAGDLGVRSVEGVTLGATLSVGNVGLTLYRQVAILPSLTDSGSGTSDIQQEFDALTCNFPVLFPGSCLQPVFTEYGTGTPDFMGQLRIAVG